VYAGHFDKADVENMEVDELVRFSRKLADQKKAERESQEEAVRKSKMKTKSR